MKKIFKKESSMKSIIFSGIAIPGIILFSMFIVLMVFGILYVALADRLYLILMSALIGVLTIAYIAVSIYKARSLFNTFHNDIYQITRNPSRSGFRRTIWFSLLHLRGIQSKRRVFQKSDDY